MPGYSSLAAVDLSSNQYCAVRLDETAGTIRLGNATSASAGILANDPAAGQAGTIIYDEETFAVCSGDITIQDTLAADDSGYLIPTTTDQDKWSAIALEAHTEDGATSVLKVMAGPFCGQERSTS